MNDNKPNTYFNFIETERRLNEEFSKELMHHPRHLAKETALWFRQAGPVHLTRYQTDRLALLLTTLYNMVEQATAIPTTFAGLCRHCQHGGDPPDKECQGCFGQRWVHKDQDR